LIFVEIAHGVHDFEEEFLFLGVARCEESASGKRDQEGSRGIKRIKREKYKPAIASSSEFEMVLMSAFDISAIKAELESL